jgi:hypothetical protein
LPGPCGVAEGSLHLGGQPVEHDCLAGAGHLRKPLAELVQGGDEAAIGLAEPERAEQQVQAVADLGLGDADHATGAAVRQPVQQHRSNRVQADLQSQRRAAAHAGWARWEQVGQAASQPSTSTGSDDRGQYDSGPDLQVGLSPLPMVWSRQH